MSSPNHPSSIHRRGGPVQQATPGLYTCAQQECSEEGCVPTGVQISCINALKNGYDMEYNGFVMTCDGEGVGYPYRACTCTIDYVNCDDVVHSSSAAAGVAPVSSVAASVVTSSVVAPVTTSPVDVLTSTTASLSSSPASIVVTAASSIVSTPTPTPASIGSSGSGSGSGSGSSGGGLLVTNPLQNPGVLSIALLFYLAAGWFWRV